MILKVAFVQAICDYHKHDLRKPKDGLKKKGPTSFASILKGIIKPQDVGR